MSDGPPVAHIERPNSNGRQLTELLGVMWHHTGPGTGDWLNEYIARNPRLSHGLSAHAVVHEDGRIVLTARHPYDVAWHAGSSRVAKLHIARLRRSSSVKPARTLLRIPKHRDASNKRGSMNSVTVGFEAVGDEKYTEPQYDSMIWLSATVYRQIMVNWRGRSRPRHFMIGHHEFTTRKVDPRYSHEELNLARSRIRNEAEKPGPLWVDLWVR